MERDKSILKSLPSAQPTITIEQAIDYLRETGWLQNHDRILTESKMVPPVQPERIKGHWIEITSINHNYKCSVCGRLLVNITDGKNNVIKHYPYCHCGADMRGNEDGTD
jgi:DNA-directed RNA polymerase subunit RPC12/RpoP